MSLAQSEIRARLAAWVFGAKRGSGVYRDVGVLLLQNLYQACDYGKCDSDVEKLEEIFNDEHGGYSWDNKIENLDWTTWHLTDTLKCSFCGDLATFTHGQLKVCICLNCSQAMNRKEYDVLDPTCKFGRIIRPYLIECIQPNPTQMV